MNRALMVAAVSMLACLSAQSSAQQPAEPPNDWSIETVTVTAPSSGPAIWRIVKGDAEVDIFGIVEPFPEHFQWNTQHLAKLVDGAHVVLLPPRAETSIFQGVWFLITERELLRPPDGKTLWDLLDAPLAARFAAARDTLHQDKDRYDDNAPAVAALRLEGDFMRVDAMTLEEPEDAVRAIAHAHGVAVRRVATYDAMPSAEELLKLPPAATSKCVDAAVSDVEIAGRHAGLAADAWAIGDLAAIKANYSEPRIYNCLLELSPLVTALDRRATADTVSNITAALGEKGRVIAVVNIGLLLRRNGVLDRLLAAGIPVEGPKE